jgi:hypothetical protein
VRYLTLAEALVIAGALTGIDHAVLAKAAGVGSLDSALPAPQAGFGGYELYSGFVDKAAIRCSESPRATSMKSPCPSGCQRA